MTTVFFLRRHAAAAMLCGAVLGSLLSATPRASAQTAMLPAARCIADVNARLGREQRLERGILFGVRAAKDEPLGTTRHLEDGSAWLKTRAGAWVSARARDPVTDAAIDARTERDWAWPDIKTRRGIFETKGVVTSELVPEVAQTFRALQCRSLAVCAAAACSQSFDSAHPPRSDDPTCPYAGGNFLVKIPGCAVIPVPRLSSCTYTERERTFDALSTVTGHCRLAAGQMMAREADMLKLAVSYDAAYRSLLQFTGTYDLFLREFEGDLLTPLRQAMSLIGQLHRIPCFLAECNE